MKKLLTLALLIATIAVTAQNTVFPVRYKVLRQTYQGDTIQTTVGDTTIIYLNGQLTIDANTNTFTVGGTSYLKTDTLPFVAGKDTIVGWDPVTGEFFVTLSASAEDTGSVTTTGSGQKVYQSLELLETSRIRGGGGVVDSTSYGVAISGGAIYSASYGYAISGGQINNASSGVAFNGSTIDNVSYGIAWGAGELNNSSQGISFNGSGIDSSSFGVVWGSGYLDNSSQGLAFNGATINNSSQGISSSGGAINNGSYGYAFGGGTINNNSYGISSSSGLIDSSSYGYAFGGGTIDNASYGIAWSGGRVDTSSDGIAWNGSIVSESSHGLAFQGGNIDSNSTGLAFAGSHVHNSQGGLAFYGGNIYHGAGLSFAGGKIQGDNNGIGAQGIAFLGGYILNDGTSGVASTGSQITDYSQNAWAIGYEDSIKRGSQNCFSNGFQSVIDSSINSAIYKSDSSKMYLSDKSLIIGGRKNYLNNCDSVVLINCIDDTLQNVEQRTYIGQAVYMPDLTYDATQDTILNYNPVSKQITQTWIGALSDGSISLTDNATSTTTMFTDGQGDFFLRDKGTSTNTLETTGVGDLKLKETNTSYDIWTLDTQKIYSKSIRNNEWFLADKGGQFYVYREDVNKPVIAVYQTSGEFLIDSLNYDANQDSVLVYNPTTGDVKTRTVTSLAPTNVWDNDLNAFSFPNNKFGTTANSRINFFTNNNAVGFIDSTGYAQFASSLNNNLSAVDFFNSNFTKGICAMTSSGSNTGHIGLFNFTGSATSSTGPNITLLSTEGSASDNADLIGQIGFAGTKNATTGSYGAIIKANASQAWGASAIGSYLTISTGHTSTSSLYSRISFNDGKISLGNGTNEPTNTPTYQLEWNGNATYIIGGARHTTSNTAGNNATLYLGSGATSGASDKNAGNAILTGGQYATGNGGSSATIQTITYNQGSGTTDRTPTDREVVASYLLADNATFALQSSRSGMAWITVGDGEEYAWFSFTQAGVVTLIQNSSNVTTTQGTNDKINVYDAGSNVSVENTFTASKQITIKVLYNL